MGRIVGVVCLFLTLAACQTTENASGKKPELYKNPNHLGWAVGYSEVCSFHRGLSVENKILAHFKKIHGDDPSFDAGYRLNSSLVGSGFVTGLQNCPHVNASLKYSYERFNNWVAEPNKSASAQSNERKRHKLSLEWDGNGDVKTYEIITTSIKTSYLRKISDYIELEKGKFCKFEWSVTTKPKGYWKFSCDDGESAKGRFDGNLTTSIYSGGGKVGSKTIDFRLVPLSEKSSG
ncbi:hypothetical protein GUA87_03935 [Sneathiella sp. P13V-1]|uniref:hypothetical protein n=1 Tax=Sneathiella sp. P13V-1 TaxID=2697366 RepID=UPI00187B78C0|nr:hypothetical protein [Sneathiella sp. P13V-1]MBE7635980.1 hypothetical protein [Sneathiella sp. P13V-1]